MRQPEREDPEFLCKKSESDRGSICEKLITNNLIQIPLTQKNLQKLQEEEERKLIEEIKEKTQKIEGEKEIINSNSPVKHNEPEIQISAKEEAEISALIEEIMGAETQNPSECENQQTPTLTKQNSKSYDNNIEKTIEVEKKNESGNGRISRPDSIQDFVRDLDHNFSNSNNKQELKDPNAKEERKEIKVEKVADSSNEPNPTENEKQKNNNVTITNENITLNPQIMVEEQKINKNTDEGNENVKCESAIKNDAEKTNATEEMKEQKEYNFEESEDDYDFIKES